MGGHVRRFVTATSVTASAKAALHPGDSAFAFTLLAPLDAQLECAVLKAITQELLLRGQRTGVYARQAVRTIGDLYGVLIDAASHDLDDVRATVLPYSQPGPRVAVQRPSEFAVRAAVERACNL